jgi:O-antigen/teichoic acid export membrane protein
LKLINTDFFKNASLLFSGSLLAQIIGFGALYFLGRIYAPEDFGEVETIMKLAGVFIAIGGLRYEMAIVVEEKTSQAEELLRLSLFLNFAISALIFCFILFFKNTIGGFFRLNDPNLLFGLPVIVWITSSTESIILWQNRAKKFKKISVNRVLFSSSGTGYKLLHPFTLVSGNGLFIGQILAQFLALLHMVYKLPVQLFKTTQQNLKAVSKTYRSFAVFSSPAAILNILATSMPVFVISAFDGQEATGYFGNAYKLTYLPMSMLSLAIGQVFFERIARIRSQKENASQMAHQLANTLFFIGIIPVIVMLVWGDQIAPLILGNQWEETGVFIQIMILFYFTMFLTSSFSSAFETYQKLKIQLGYNFIFLASTFGALYLGYTLGGNTRTALAWFTGVGIVLRLAILNYFFVLFGKNLIAKTIFAILITGVLAYLGFSIKGVLLP